MTSNLAGFAVDIGLAAPPRVVRSGRAYHRVVAAVYLPTGLGESPAHVVVYHRAGRYDPVPAEDTGYVVALFLHDEDEQRLVLTQGTYGLTYAQALRELVRRISTGGDPS